MPLQPITLENEQLRVVVAPELGASLLAFQRRVGNLWVDIFLNSTETHSKGRRGYFAMLPWTARMRGKTFPWNEANGSIPRAADNVPKFQVSADWHPHAIHGYGPKLPWKVKGGRNKDSVELTLASADHPGFVYPSQCELRIVYRIEGGTLHVNAEIQNVGSQSMPVGGGSHPFIPKYLTGCIAPPKLQFNATHWYPPRTDEPTEAMPAGNIEPLPAGLNFAELRTATEGWDCALSGWDGLATAVWEEAGVKLEVFDCSMEPTGLLHLWYAKDKGTFAFEPIVAVGDGLNVESRGGPSGVRILSPSEVSKFCHGYRVDLL